LLGQGDINPAGELIGFIPCALAVPEQYEFVCHTRILCGHFDRKSDDADTYGDGRDRFVQSPGRRANHTLSSIAAICAAP
jgi:hypothetical protein